MESDEKIITDRFVWCDPKGYKKLQKRGGLIIIISIAAGVVPYCLLFQKFMEGQGVSIAIGVIAAIILMCIFHKRLWNQMAAFVRYDGLLYRVSDANRGITRIAEDNDREAPYFEADFRRARKGNTCWRILKVEGIEQQKNGMRVYCRVCKSKSGKECHKDFYIEDGYLNRDSLIEQLQGLTENA